MANSADPDQLVLQKPTDLDLHCLQRQGISGHSRTRVKAELYPTFQHLNGQWQTKKKKALENTQNA